MLKLLLDRVTYANVVATLALFLALGGAAYAKFKLPANSVKSSSIANRQIRSVDVRKNALTGANVKETTLTGSTRSLDYRSFVDDAGTKLFKLGPWTVTAACSDLNPTEVVELRVKGPASEGTYSALTWNETDPVDDGYTTTAILGGVATPVLSVSAGAVSYKHEYGVYFVRSNHTVAQFNVHTFANGTGDGKCSIVGTATLGS